MWTFGLCAENERCAPRRKLFPQTQERTQNLTTLPSAEGLGRHKPIETSTQASTRSVTGGRPCDRTLQMLRRGMKDLCRVKRSCGGEGGKCSLAFLETRGISWRGHPKNLKLLHVVRCYPLRCMVNVQRIERSRHTSLTAPWLPPHLCYEQGVNDHCKKKASSPAQKTKNGRPPATVAQG